MDDRCRALTMQRESIISVHFAIYYSCLLWYLVNRGWDMPLVVTLGEAQEHEFRREVAADDDRKAGASRLPYFGSEDDPNVPFATLNKHDSGRYSGVHFHRIDQFQVVVGGRGMIGRHPVAPLCVRFVRAYTPYGPVQSHSGLAFFVLRARSEKGSLHFPEARQELERVPNRHPFQVTRPAVFPALRDDADVVEELVPDLRDEHGLSVHTLTMNSDSTTVAPDPSRGAGQYALVITGSLLHNGAEYDPLSLVYIGPQEPRLPLRAGATGLQVLILNFPRTHSTSVMPFAAGPHNWRCTWCGYVYEEGRGSPEDHIPRHTSWEKLPPAWTCPDCDAPKGDFRRAV